MRDYHDSSIRASEIQYRIVSEHKMARFARSHRPTLKSATIRMDGSRRVYRSVNRISREIIRFADRRYNRVDLRRGYRSITRCIVEAIQLDQRVLATMEFDALNPWCARRTRYQGHFLPRLSRVKRIAVGLEYSRVRIDRFESTDRARDALSLVGKRGRRGKRLSLNHSAECYRDFIRKSERKERE